MSIVVNPLPRPRYSRPARVFVVTDPNALSVAVGAVHRHGWDLILRDDDRSVFRRESAFEGRLFCRIFGRGYLVMEMRDARNSEHLHEGLHLLTLSIPTPMRRNVTRRFCAVTDQVADQLAQVGMLRDKGNVISTGALPVDSISRSGAFRSLLKGMRRSR